MFDVVIVNDVLEVTPPLPLLLPITIMPIFFTTRPPPSSHVISFQDAYSKLAAFIQ